MACFDDELNKILVHIVNYVNRKHIKNNKCSYYLAISVKFFEVDWCLH